MRQLNRTTLLRQALLERAPWSAPEAIGRLAGLQAQHANSPYVALWSRAEAFTIAALEAALRDRSVVKGTLMRSTLHLVSAEDVAAFDAAGAPSRIANWRPTARRAGVDILELHRQLIAYAAEPRSVAEMEAFLERIVPNTSIADHAPSGVRGVGFRLASAPGRLVHVPPSGLWASHAKPRYIDLGVWLPQAVAPDPAEALRLAAIRYLTAYGPASIADFAKWVGQSRITAARAAIEALGDRVRRYTGPDGRELVDLDGLPIATGDEPAPGRFLARWDSVVIGYDVRDRIMPPRPLPGRGPGEERRLPAHVHGRRVRGRVMADARPSAGKRSSRSRRPCALTERSVRAGLTEEAERLVRFVAPEATRHEVRWADA